MPGQLDWSTGGIDVDRINISKFRAGPREKGRVRESERKGGWRTGRRVIKEKDYKPSETHRPVEARGEHRGGGFR
jgi:hypothetical protein